MKRVISVALILLTLLCSSEVFSQIDPVVKDKADTETQYAEFSQDVSQEFREGFKLGFSEEDRSTSHGICSSAVNFAFQTVAYLEYRGHQKEFLSRRSSTKLFIDFGSIII
ncbi:MAG: hypothetical protein WDN75_03955 [Bacteroidota bacterium]